MLSDAYLGPLANVLECVMDELETKLPALAAEMREAIDGFLI
jgi:hypothetical protein